MNTEALSQFLQQSSRALAENRDVKIPLGQVVQGEAIKNATGQVGVLIEGEFIETPLPPSVQLGQALKLVLAQQDGKLTVQFLDQALAQTGTENNKEIKNVFENILKTILPELSLKDLKTGYQTKTSLVNLLPPEQGAAQAQQNITQLQSAFEKLFGANLAINPEKLSKQPAILQVIKTIISQQIGAEKESPLQKILQELKADPKVLGQQKVALDPVRQLTQIVKERVESLSQQKVETLFQQYQPSPQSEPQSTFQQKLAPLFNQLQIPPLPTSSPLQIPNSPLGEILEGLLRIQLSKSSGTESVFGNEKITQILSEITQQLQNSIAEESKGDAQKVLRKLLRILDLGIKKDQLNSEQIELTPQKATKDTPLTRLLEQVQQSHENLSKLLPLMQTVGEPLFFIMPAIIGGIFQNWEMRIDKLPYDFEEGEEDEGKNKEEFMRVHLAIGLPGLGPVQIDLAHRTQEILMSLTFENEEVMEFVDKALPDLERKFVAGGYKRASLITRTGEPKSVKPKWFEALESRLIA